MRILLSMLFGLILAFGAAAPASALGFDPTDVERIKRALEDALNAVAAKATDGESVRGASGSLATVIRGADSEMCAGWEIHYLRLVEALERERVTATLERQNRIDVAHQKLRKLQDVIERACDRVGNPEPYANLDPSRSDLPVEPEAPTADCSAECQRLRAAYFAASQQLWDIRDDCRWLKATETRISALPLAIEQTRATLADSRARRDSAKRLYDRIPTHKNLHAWNAYKLEVERFEKQLTDFEAQLAGAEPEAVRARREACEQRLRDAQQARETAFQAWVDHDRNGRSYAYQAHRLEFCDGGVASESRGRMRFSLAGDHLVVEGWPDGADNSFVFRGEVRGMHFQVDGSEMLWSTADGLPEAAAQAANARHLHWALRGNIDRKTLDVTDLSDARYCVWSKDGELVKIDTVWRTISLSAAE